jgi:hypothetical protein
MEQKHIASLPSRSGKAVWATKALRVVVLAGTLAISAFTSRAFATGLATCDSGPKSGWQAVEKLEKMLAEKGWVVRRIKEDGGCYEVYALNEKGERVEAYFHPVTLAPVPTKR